MARNTSNTTTKTIVLIQNVDVPTQGATDIHYYAKELKNLGHKVFIICKNAKHTITGICYYETKKGGATFTRKAIKYLKEIDEQQGYIDYTHFFCQSPTIVPILWYTKHNIQTTTIYDIRSGPIGKGPIAIIAKQTMKKCHEMADKTIVIHKQLIKKLKLKPHKCIEISLGATKPDYHKNKELAILYIGTLSKERKLEPMIDALNEIPNITFIIGTGDDEENLKKVARDHIIFLGQMNHKNTLRFVNRCNIMISYIPTLEWYDYQLPLKTVEYLIHNKITIATKTKVHEKIFKNKRLLCEANKQSVKNTINYVLNNYKTLKKEDYSKWVKDHKWKKLVKTMDRIVYVD